MRIGGEDGLGAKDATRARDRPLVRSASLRPGPQGASQRYVFAKIAQALGLLVAAFLLLRVIGPWLIDMHYTPALILAAVLLLAGLFAIAWFAWTLFVSITRKV